ncbi:MAG: AI-2E family transporter [Acidobacteria bacterium]|nr:AI-2E family transporter [Acidobacteriota bacterium]MBS1865658.1 AI-2E family transporter [Acidobacteriota bacterium]
MKNTVAAKTTTSDRLTTVLSYGALLLLGYCVYRIVEPFFVPLAWSAVFAIFFTPLHERIAKKLKPTPSALVSTVGVTFLLVVPSLALGTYTARQAMDATTKAQAVLTHPDTTAMDRVEAWLKSKFPASMQDVDFSEQFRQGAEKAAAYLAGKLTGLAKNLVDFFVDLFLMLFALFFMFRDGKEVVRGVKHLLPFDSDIQSEMLAESRELIFASVAVALVIALMQGALGGLAFTIVGITSPLFWGVLIAFFSLVPVVGSALIWVPAGIWIGLNGHWGKAVVILAICGGVAGVADNLVRPLLLRNRTRLNELLLFISVLGGIEVFGLLGIVAGPTIMAAAMGVFRVYMEHRDEMEDAAA